MINKMKKQLIYFAFINLFFYDTLQLYLLTLLGYFTAKRKKRKKKKKIS